MDCLWSNMIDGLGKRGAAPGCPVLRRGKVASFKIPRHVVFIDEFPMTASGKIRKVELRADAAERFKPE